MICLLVLTAALAAAPADALNETFESPADLTPQGKIDEWSSPG